MKHELTIRNFYYKDKICLWEEMISIDGKITYSVICNKNGNKKRAKAVTEEAYEQMALIPIDLSDYYIKICKEEKIVSIEVYKVAEIRYDSTLFVLNTCVVDKCNYNQSIITEAEHIFEDCSEAVKFAYLKVFGKISKDKLYCIGSLEDRKMKKDYIIFPARQYEGKMCVEEKVAVYGVMDKGHIILICNSKGNKKKEIREGDDKYMFTGSSGSYTTFHARIPVEKGDYIIELHRNPNVITLDIYEVMIIANNGLLLELVYHEQNAEWDAEDRRKINNYDIFGILAKAVKAAHMKVYDINYVEKPYCISANKKQVRNK